MKATVEIPDTLAEKLQKLAIKQASDFDATIINVLEQGLMTSFFSDKRPVKLSPPLTVAGGPLSFEDIEAAIADGRD